MVKIILETWSDIFKRQFFERFEPGLVVHQGSRHLTIENNLFVKQQFS